MPKGFFEDMVRVKRESQAQKRPMPAKRAPVEFQTPQPASRPVKKEAPKVEKKELPRRENTEFASVYDLPSEDRGGERSSRGIWILAGVCVAVFLFAISFLFSEAKVALEPKSADITLNKNFFAAKGGLTNDLSFDLVVVNGEEKRTVAGTEEKQVTKSAEGSVVIYNNYSSAVQRLDINTRLEGSNGKIYKTKKAVTVPGRKADGTPGSIEVGVYAAEAGESYNSAPLDFTIFGFRGTPKYSKFYARSNGEISGGFSGVTRTLGAEEQTKLRTEMRQALEAMLIGKVEGSIPEGFILFDKATSLVIDEEVVEQSPEGGSQVVVSLKGTLYGFLIDEAKLTKKIAETSVSGYDGGEVFIPDLQNLNFSISNKDALAFKDTNNMTFNISGTGKLFWKINEEEIISELAGRRKKEFSQVLGSHSSVEKGTVSLSPFWRRSFPDKIKDIELVVNYPR